MRTSQRKLVMKKIIKAYIKQTLIIYLFVYLIVSFVSWSFKNPIQWILDIPIYENFDRFSILIGWFMYTWFSIAINLHLIQKNYESSNKQ